MTEQVGPGTATPRPIPLEMFREQRHRLGAALAKKQGGGGGPCVALIQAGSEIPRNYTDTNYVFKQDAYFYHLFGYEVPDCFGCVFADGKGIIFIPRLPESYATWMGPLPNAEFVCRVTGIDECFYTDEIGKVFGERGIKTVHVMEGKNSDSGLSVLTASFEGQDAFTIDKTFLFEELSEIRVFKTQKEIELLAWINSISSDAHVKVMQLCKPGLSQHQLESTFLHNVYYNGGCRHASYTCICATGPYGAILHYPDNNRPVEDGQMALLDMGGEYHCYASDITCSFPTNGKFTQKQKFVYNAVLDAQVSCMKAMKPGVLWPDMHLLALRTMCKHLVAEGLLINGTVEELMEKNVMRVFQPHGLGHLIGLDVHDVGAYPAGGPTRPTRPDSSRLRTARVLQENMFITVEPGMYFNKVLLEQAFADPAIKMHFNEKKIREEFWEFGGVRIEDDVIITKDGVADLTCCPRTVEEVEATMAGMPWDVNARKTYKNI